MFDLLGYNGGRIEKSLPTKGHFEDYGIDVRFVDVVEPSLKDSCRYYCFEDILRIGPFSDHMREQNRHVGIIRNVSEEPSVTISGIRVNQKYYFTWDSLKAIVQRLESLYGIRRKTKLAHKQAASEKALWSDLQRDIPEPFTFWAAVYDPIFYVEVKTIDSREFFNHKISKKEREFVSKYYKAPIQDTAGEVEEDKETVDNSDEPVHKSSVSRIKDTVCKLLTKALNACADL